MLSENWQFLAPFSNPIVVFFIKKVYVDDRLWGYPPPPYRDDKKSDNIQYNTMERWIDGTIVPPSDGPRVRFQSFLSCKKVKNNTNNNFE